MVLGGAPLAKGYRNPSSPDPFAEPGWFATDDAGSLDADGVLTVHGRLDGAIGTGGLTVLPEVVEAVIARHPAVGQCAVFGVPDDRLGQRVVAAVVPASVDDPPSSGAAPRSRRRVAGRHRGATRTAPGRRAARPRHRQGGPAGADGAVQLLRCAEGSWPSLENQVERCLGGTPELRETTVVDHHLSQPLLARLRTECRPILRE